MPKHSEISRFSINGKTFFFNKSTARNDSVYLAVNSLYGKGNQERLTLFRPHFMDFREHYDRAIREITGFNPSERRMVEECPDCGSNPRQWRTLENESGKKWCIVCIECREIIFENDEGAYEEATDE